MPGLVNGLNAWIAGAGAGTVRPASFFGGYARYSAFAAGLFSGILWGELAVPVEVICLLASSVKDMF